MGAPAWLAAGVGAVGGVAVVLDLGNRLLGCYRRTVWTAAWRMALVLAGGVVFIAPLFLLLAGQTWAGLWAWLAAPVGVAAVVHLFRPCRHGVERIPPADCAETVHPLADGLTLVRCELAFESLPPALDGLRLVVLADIHCNTSSALYRLRRQAVAVAACEPDLLLVLGDLGQRTKLLPGVVEALASVPVRLGAFAVRGNHDIEFGRDRVVADLLAATPIRLLDNRAVTVNGLSLIGVEAPWNPGAMPAPGDEDFRIALSHSPDNLFALERLGADLVVAGHTHGGQPRVPRLAPLLAPSRYGNLLARGAYRLRRTTLYVTPGFGYFSGGRLWKGEVAELVLRRHS